MRPLLTARTRVLVPLVLALVVAATLASPAGAVDGWAWPVTGPVIRAFDPPDSPFGAGHRGIDVAVPQGTVVAAAAPGTVSFAGPVGGNLFLTLDHGGGWESTFSWVSALLVRKGDVVAAGQPVALTGWGHPTATVPHLHFGIKLDDVYLDPLTVLPPPDLSSLIRLAPL
jgi:murein DD-endopeptidase MepM/ murein hydrolase activator NlpD